MSSLVSKYLIRVAQTGELEADVAKLLFVADGAVDFQRLCARWEDRAAAAARVRNFLCVLFAYTPFLDPSLYYQLWRAFFASAEWAAAERLDDASEDFATLLIFALRAFVLNAGTLELFRSLAKALCGGGAALAQLVARAREPRLVCTLKFVLQHHLAGFLSAALFEEQLASELSVLLRQLVDAGCVATHSFESLHVTDWLRLRLDCAVRHDRATAAFAVSDFLHVPVAFEVAVKQLLRAPVAAALRAQPEVVEPAEASALQAAAGPNLEFELAFIAMLFYLNGFRKPEFLLSLDRCLAAFADAGAVLHVSSGPLFYSRESLYELSLGARAGLLFSYFLFGPALEGGCAKSLSANQAVLLNAALCFRENLERLPFVDESVGTAERGGSGAFRLAQLAKHCAADLPGLLRSATDSGGLLFKLLALQLARPEREYVRVDGQPAPREARRAVALALCEVLFAEAVLPARAERATHGCGFLALLLRALRVEAADASALEQLQRALFFWSEAQVGHLLALLAQAPPPESSAPEALGELAVSLPARFLAPEALLDVSALAAEASRGAERLVGRALWTPSHVASLLVKSASRPEFFRHIVQATDAVWLRAGGGCGAVGATLRFWHRVVQFVAADATFSLSDYVVAPAWRGDHKAFLVFCLRCVAYESPEMRTARAVNGAPLRASRLLSDQRLFHSRLNLAQIFTEAELRRLVCGFYRVFYLLHRGCSAERCGLHPLVCSLHYLVFLRSNAPSVPVFAAALQEAAETYALPLRENCWLRHAPSPLREYLAPADGATAGAARLDPTRFEFGPLRAERAVAAQEPAGSAK